MSSSHENEQLDERTGSAPAERLLVCVSPGMLEERLVRAARQMADNRNVEWFAVYVETPEHAQLTSAEKGRIAHLLHLAEQLGAKVLTLSGTDAAEAILHYARTHHVTGIVAGMPAHRNWTRLWGRSTVDRILTESDDFDVHLIRGESVAARPLPLRTWRPQPPWRRYLLSVALVALVTLLGAPMVPTLAPTNLVMVYLVAVVVAAIYLGREPSIVVALLSVLALDFFFVPPHFTFAVSDTQYILTFFGFTIVGLVISALTARVREQADIARRRELQTTELYEFSRDLAAAVGLDDILHAIISHVGQTFGREAVVWLSGSGSLAVSASSPGSTVTEAETAVAQWALEHGEPAGRYAATFATAAIRCMPLKTARGVVGVLGIGSPEASASLALEHRRTLESFASQAALAIERAQFAEQARQAQVLQATEKLQSALLNSISHDLRTPLVSITGTLSSLQEDGLLGDPDSGTRWDPQTRRTMVETAYADALRLNHLVGNLLDMTRIEAGAMRVRQELSDAQDAIGSALDQLSSRLQGREVAVDIPAALPLVPMDFVLIVQVLANLIDNAVKYSPPGTPVEIKAGVVAQDLEIRVSDRGIGIPVADLQRVFDKFYRVRRPDGVVGTGLGLAICKGIVEAHDGSIRAALRQGGGTTVVLTLPLERRIR